MPPSFLSDHQTRILQSPDVVAVPNVSDLAMRIVVEGHVWGYVGFLGPLSDRQTPKRTLRQSELVRPHSPGDWTASNSDSA